MTQLLRSTSAFMPRLLDGAPSLTARLLVHPGSLVLLATHGETGVDCSPRGDPGQAAFVDDPHTLVLPDRPGNNRIDSIRNILHDPQVGLLFLVPGVNEGFRVNGVARLTRDPAVLERYAYLGRPPVTLIVVEVHEAFLHCARALLRSDEYAIGYESPVFA
ncbi:hypothetical protein E7T09_16285 [Deinococcus sp. KSM4-11]|uniref:pyridoxamine 5'-phosphate oxidase family protein n=1 Tax=Deinococcus sp. KSM4-11 TaxID=2568654 RepID=UPI0010A49B54|nr:pyridoxamine 5'-phosphate oxidase family protein [Deinococcus sp. KSM4-11]THF85513.1 hypothetical protein E7T09_16285 [Deinococcus sp. KSM4-11]